MIKPLLRILPSLSGNVKLTCILSDVACVDSNKKIYESNIRGAKLLPLSSHLWQKKIDANLLNSTWEYDLPKFYSTYSDVFYNTCFSFDKSDALMLDRHNAQYVKATDFEFGVKRISYSKNNCDFAFFAPLYIDNANDIPDYFLINITLYNTNDEGQTIYATKRSLRVNIGLNGDAKENYIYKYLYKYLNKIDNNVIFCNTLTNQATCYGIDLRNSGFVTAVDNGVERLYRKQNTIQNFDATIAGAYKRNYIAIRQIIPLCYYFSLNDVLSELEKVKYRNCRVEFDGVYYKDGNELCLYDFSHDYTQYNENILTMNPLTGNMQWRNGDVSNIMDVMFPSLNDKNYIKYEFANKLAPWFCRWKLKYSDDEHPYIINNSWAFCKNQNSNYKYGQFPHNILKQLPSLAKYDLVDNTNVYNLMFPLGDINDITSGKALYAYAPILDISDINFGKGQYYYIIDDYQRYMENYISNWFNVVSESDDIYSNADIWEDVDNGIVYYNGILYDLNNIYSNITGTEKIDKFAVLLHPNLTVYNKNNISNLCYSKYSLYRQGISQMFEMNAVANDSLLTLSQLQTSPNYIYSNDDFDTGDKINTDKIDFNNIYVEDINGSFIDMTNTAYAITNDSGKMSYGRMDLDYYKLNRYYTASDLTKIIDIVNDVTNELYNTEDEEMQQMITSYVEPYYGKHGDVNYDMSSYISNAYVFTPIYKGDSLAYNDIVFSYEKTLSSWDWSAYIEKSSYAEVVMAYNTAYDYYIESRNAWQSYNSIPIDVWRFTHNSTIMNIPSAYASMKHDDNMLLDIMQQNSYIRYVNDDTTYMNGVKVEGNIVSYEYSYSYSYISFNSNIYNNTNYGVQNYFNSYLINSTYIPYITEVFDAYSYMRNAFTESGASLMDATYFFNWETKDGAAYWGGRLMDWKSRVGNEIYKRIYNSSISTGNIQEYEYTPVLQENQIIYAKNIFKERSCWTGHFYGDAIPASKVNNDKNVLWADQYNLVKLFEISGKEFPSDAIEETMNVKFLNKTHLFYWYIELFKDKYRKWNNKTNYNDFLQNKWYKYLYVAEKKLIYDYEETAAPQVKIIYTPLEKLLEFPEYYLSTDEQTTYAYNIANNPYRSFITFFNNIKYNSLTGMFTLPGFMSDKFVDDTGSYVYAHRYEETAYSYIGSDNKEYNSYVPISFDLVFRKDMYRVEKELWDITNISEDGEEYKDIYFYRLQSDAEFETKYNNAGRKIAFQSDLSYIKSDMEKIESYTYTALSQRIKPGPYTYKYAIGYYKTPHTLSNNGMSYIGQTDSMLVPMFDDIFIQPSSKSEIYTHYTLNNINICNVVEDTPNENGSFNITTCNYRYNVPNTLMMINVSDNEKSIYNFVKTYKEYNSSYSQLVVKDDDLGYGKYNLSTKVADDGTKYGFYYINSHINNTTNTLNMLGVYNKEFVSNIKYVDYINGINIIKYPQYVTSIYKQMLPFISHNPLETFLINVNTILYPQNYSIDLVYSQQMHNTNNGSRETDIVMNKQKICTMNLYRYFNSIVPYISPVKDINNEWRLKLKDVDAQIINTGEYLSLGDSVIYNTKVNINKFEPYNVYSTSDDKLSVKNYNNITSIYTPLEYKFYNNSKAVNLTPYFEIKVPGQLTYTELLEKEKLEYVYNIFDKYINGMIRRKYNNDETLFLFNKYNVSYNSVPIGLNISQTEKLYMLTIVFKLK